MKVAVLARLGAQWRWSKSRRGIGKRGFENQLQMSDNPIRITRSGLGLASCTRHCRSVRFSSFSLIQEHLIQYSSELPGAYNFSLRLHPASRQRVAGCSIWVIFTVHEIEGGPWPSRMVIVSTVHRELALALSARRCLLAG